MQQQDTLYKVSGQNETKRIQIKRQRMRNIDATNQKV